MKRKPCSCHQWHTNAKNGWLQHPQEQREEAQMTINGIALAIAIVMCALAYFCGYMSGRNDEREERK